MPNWVFNTVSASREVLESFISEDDNGESIVDFNRIIQMPGVFEGITIGSYIDEDGNSHERWREKVVDGKSIIFPLSKDEIEELLQRFGVDNWYDWSLQNWGCKWNASDSDFGLNDGFLQFNTPWSPPDHFYLALSAKFPNENINVFWEEETGFGRQFTIRNGSIYESYEWDSPDCEDLDEFGTYAEKYKGHPDRPNNRWIIEGDDSITFSNLVEVRDHLKS